MKSAPLSYLADDIPRKGHVSERDVYEPVPRPHQQARARQHGAPPTEDTLQHTET